MLICTNDWTFGPGADCRRFDFTLEFSQIWLLGVPALVYIGCGTLKSLSLWKTHAVTKCRADWKASAYALLAAKVFAPVVLMAASILATSSWPSVNNSWSIKFAQSSNIVVAVVLAGSSLLQHFRCLRSDMILSGYLLTAILCDTALIRSYYLVGFTSSHATIAVSAYLRLAGHACLLLAENTNKATLLARKPSGQPLSAEAVAPNFSRLFFVWLDPLLYRGFRQRLTMDMLGNLDPALETEGLYTRAEKDWERCAADGKRFPLIRTIFASFRQDCLAPIVPNLLAALAQITTPVLIMNLLQFLSSYEDGNIQEPAEFGYGLGAAYALVFTIQTLSFAQFELSVNRNMAQIRGFLVEAIYRKTLDCHLEVVGQAGAGLGTSLMSVDAERVVRTLVFLHEFLSAIVTIAIGFAIIWHAIGTSSLATLITAVIALTVCPLWARGVGKAQAEWSARTDKRIRLLSSVFGAMKQIKLSAYEDTLVAKADALRERELSARASMYTRLLRPIVATNFLANVMNISTLVTFYLVNRHSDRFSVTAIFTLFSTIAIISRPMLSLGQHISGMMAAWASLLRIEEFLMKREFSRGEKPPLAAKDSTHDHATGPDSTIELKAVPNYSNRDPDSTDLAFLPNLPLKAGQPSKCPAMDSVFYLSDVALSYNDVPVLTKLDMNITQGMLVMVIGGVGAGKTTLLKALLGEVDKTGGQWKLPLDECVALATQDGWLQEGLSIRDNICFLSDYDRPWYDQVIRAAALDVDFALMDKGDRRLAQGLSGGQVQRICLARALYSKASIYVLDDCFSALDAHTEAHIFDALFSSSGILGGKTVVLATNSVHRLARADHIVALADSTIIEQGSFQHLMHNGRYAREVVKNWDKREEKEGASSNIESSPNAAAPSDSANPSLAASEGADLIALELAGKHWHGDPIIAFARSAGIFLSTITILITVAAAAMSGLTPLYTSIWLDTDAPSLRYLLGYIGMELVYLFAFAFSAYMVFLPWSMAACRTLHGRLLSSVVATDLAFFDDTPTGTVLNRFSQDVNSVDQSFGMWFWNALMPLASMAVAAILIAVATYYCIPIVAVAALFFVLTQRFYIRSSTELRKLALASKSPLYTAFSQTIDPTGLQVIRAFKGARQLTEKNTQLATDSQTPYYLMLVVKRWLSVVLGLISACINVTLVFLAVSQRHSPRVGIFAVALQQGASLTLGLEFLFTAYSELETEATSVTRIMQFGSLPPEEDAREANDSGSGSSKDDTFYSGSISFNNVTLRYQPDATPALHNVNLQIPDGTRIGLVGRTGSGKSTVLSALLRLKEMDAGGVIFIDGTSITAISRKQLRSQIANVPQDPLLLDLTLRENLDLEGVHSDESIWRALEVCGAKDLVAALDDKLDAQVSANGSAFSRGQRQLLALARVVLSPRKIICLDEASSSIDSIADARIQQAIRQEFQDRTVLCVAHRLATVIDYDVICVLDAGRIIEKGPPKELLRRPGGAFAKLAMEQGLIGVVES